ncbi:MAG: response regulator [Chloroflexi bacterium]|nr:MAG: response regulator [Chloroflexota bacterium]
MNAAILLVEDEPDIAQMFSLGLSIAGHEVEVAGDGCHAVDRARSKRFDLVLLDVELPRIDGLKTLEFLRSNGPTHDLPIAMLTNSGDETQRRRAHSLGILDWLVKSEITPAELARRATAWTSRVKTAIGGERIH